MVQVIISIYLGLRDVWADRRLRGLLVFTIGMIGLATVSFRLIEGWSWIDSAFFAVVTISTVGYGNMVPVTVFGKLFTMFYILVGLGVFVAAATAVAEALLRRREAQDPKDDD